MYTVTVNVVVFFFRFFRLYSHYFHNLGVQGKEGNEADFHRLVKKSVFLLEQCFRRRSTRECVYDACVNGDLSIHKVI